MLFPSFYLSWKELIELYVGKDNSEFVIFLLCLKYLTFKYLVVFTYVAFSLQLILLKLGWQMP